MWNGAFLYDMTSPDLNTNGFGSLLHPGVALTDDLPSNASDSFIPDPSQLIVPDIPVDRKRKAEEVYDFDGVFTNGAGFHVDEQESHQESSEMEHLESSSEPQQQQQQHQQEISEPTQQAEPVPDPRPVETTQRRSSKRIKARRRNSVTSTDSAAAASPASGSARSSSSEREEATETDESPPEYEDTAGVKVMPSILEHFTGVKSGKRPILDVPTKKTGSNTVKMSIADVVDQLQDSVFENSRSSVTEFIKRENAVCVVVEEKYLKRETQFGKQPQICFQDKKLLKNRKAEITFNTRTQFLAITGQCTEKGCEKLFYQDGLCRAHKGRQPKAQSPRKLSAGGRRSVGKTTGSTRRSRKN